MTFRFYVFLMGFATALCWGAFGAVIYAIDPFTNGISGIAFFYVSLFFALVGTLALLGIVIRKIFFHEEPRFVQVAVAFRQSILFAALILSMLALSRAQLLRWWLVPILIAFFTVIEYLLLSFFQRHPTPTSNQNVY